MFMYKMSMFLCMMLSSLSILASDAGGVWNNMALKFSDIGIIYTMITFSINIYILHYFLRIPYMKALWRFFLLSLWLFLYSIGFVAVIVAIIFTTGKNVWYIEVFKVFKKCYRIDGLVANFNQLVSGQDLGYLFLGLVLFVLMMILQVVAQCYIYRRHIDPAVNRHQLYKAVVCFILFNYVSDLFYYSLAMQDLPSDTLVSSDVADTMSDV